MLSPLRLGRYELGVPVVLAPMAGVTNRAFRRLCREQGAGLYVCEMVTSRALVERNAETLRMAQFDDDESPRSLQLYGVDPATVGAAVEMVVAEDLADHIDLNMGCPVPKVTRKGGGAALPWKLDLFAAICVAALDAAASAARARGLPEPPPVTVKMRMGIDVDHLTYLDAGQIAADAGMAWVALHGRTAQQRYSGRADWRAIATLVEALAPMGVPVLGNGDIWSADDALAMVQRTSCAGVVVGRGCLGRPWLFGQLAAAFAGEPVPDDPDSGQVLEVMRRHAGLLVELLGPDRGPRDFRKHVAWYLKGFRAAHHVRVGLANVASLAELDELLAQIDPDQPFPTGVGTGPRGRTSGGKSVALPEGWLDSRTIDGAGAAAVAQGEVFSSGG
ncbi:MAG: tRNA dihydrouridine synthase DusB [Candidatus Nanopelagicales bacterium]